MRLRTHSTVSGVLLSVLLAMSWTPDRLSRPYLALAAATADFYVSPKGNDSWSGRLADPGQNNGPFATVARAQQAVRALLATGKKPVRVVLRGGTYYLDRTLEFGPEDSGTENAPVIYAAAKGEEVILSGGRRLEGGSWGEVNGHKAWVVDIAGVNDGQWRFRELFVNGARCPRTRLPKQGDYRIESLPGYNGSWVRGHIKKFVYAPGNIVPTWRNLRDVEVIGICFWIDNRLPIESVDGQTRTVTFDRSSLFALENYEKKPGAYWVENVFEALDTAGQWYLDRPLGKLYYLPRPGENMTTAEIIAPRQTRVVRVVGRPDRNGSATGATAHDIRFEGLTFSHTEWEPPADYASSLQAGSEVPGAVLFDYAERCAVTDGAIEHIGNTGIEVNVGCADIELSRNRITDIGAGGIRIGHFFSWEEGDGGVTEWGLKRKASLPKGPHSQRVTIADNEIGHCGQFTRGAVGIFVGDNANNRVIHNHVHHTYYSGISVGSFQNQEYPEPSQAKNNIVEYNHVHDIGQGMLDDLGGIYTCRTPQSRIRFNVVHDVKGRGADSGIGLYQDEGSRDLLVANNLVYRCRSAWAISYTCRNLTRESNILAYCTHAQLWGYSGEYPHQFTFRHNLVYYAQGAVGAAFTRTQSAFDYNLYHKIGGGPVMFGDKNFAQWQATGQDKHSVVADPLFVDPAKGDFRLKPGSPAEKIGFEPWDFSTIGPRPSSATGRATSGNR